MDQLVEADLHVAWRWFRSPCHAASVDLFEERLAAPSRSRTCSTHARSSGRSVSPGTGVPAGAGARSRKIVGCRSVIAPSDVVCDDEEPAVKDVAATVPDRRGEDVEPGRRLCGAGRRRPRRAADRRGRARAASSRTTSNSGWPGVTHSSVGSVGSSCLVEDDLLVLAAELAEARLQPLADRPEVARHAADAVDVAALGDRLADARRRSARPATKKSSITSGTSRRSFASADLPTMAERFSSRLARPSSVEFGDLAEALGVDLLDDPALDQLLGHGCGRTCRGSIRSS